MAINNIVEVIQERLGFQPLQKINPNTQEVKDPSSQDQNQKLAQAAIPAVITALYLYATSEEGTESILRGNKSTEWIDDFFGPNKEEAIAHVAEYASVDKHQAADTMERTATEAVQVIRDEIAPDAGPNAVNEFMTNQRDNILIYLPASLQIGKLLKDNTLDDRTNKMEGPVSGFMHMIEKMFSQSTDKKD